MSGRPPPRRRSRRGLGQHFLGSASLAAKLVSDAAIEPRDHVIDLGAGTGTLTAALASRGAWTVAVELDAALVTGLTRRFAGVGNVAVFASDATEFPLPSTPYRVLANPPFSRTAAILHHLLDQPIEGLVRADLVVQWQVARTRAQAGDTIPLDLVGASWGPWWCFQRGRRLPAKFFQPPPSVDAAILTVTRREPALLPGDVAPEYLTFVRERFARATPSQRIDDWVRAFNSERTTPLSNP